MMENSRLEEAIAKSTKELPKTILQEILDFIEFIVQKRLGKVDNLSKELTGLAQSETLHLEEEFKDYKELYPREEE